MGFLKRLWKANSATESNISRALRAVVERDTPTARRNLHNALRQQRLILPVPKLPDNLERDASGRLQQNVRLDFLSIQDRHGRKSLAVFTNPGALKKWTPTSCVDVDSGGHSVDLSYGTGFRLLGSANQPWKS
jgi:hypothetical protein